MGKPPPRLIEKETIEYLHRIELLLDGTDGADPSSSVIDDPEIFVSNVLEEVRGGSASGGAAAAVLMDPEASRVIEKVLRVATRDNLLAFAGLVFPRLEELCFHRNASHVVQTLLCLAPDVVDQELAQGDVIPVDHVGRASYLDDEEDGDGDGDGGEDKDDEAKGSKKQRSKRQQQQQPQHRPGSMQELLFDMGELMMDGWANLAFDQYGSHLFRVILNVLTGRKPEALARSKASQAYNAEKNNTVHYGVPNSGRARKKGGAKSAVNADILLAAADPLDEALEEVREVPAAFPRLVDRITRAFLAQLGDDDFAAMAVDPVASPLLQLLMVAQEKNPEMLGLIVMRFFDSVQRSHVTIQGAEATLGSGEGEEGGDTIERGKAFVQGLITHPIGSHVVQRLLQVCPANLHNRLYTEYFRRHIARFCEHGIANFVVASLVKGVKSDSIFGLIVDELVEIAESLMVPTRANIVRQAVVSCLRFPAHEKTVMKLVSAGLHANTAQERKHLFQLIVYLCKHEDLDARRHAITPLGSLIATGLYNFAPNLCKPLVDSFLAISTDILLQWCLDPLGSRAVESFLRGCSVELASKAKLVKRLKGHYVELALNKFGSHIVDLFWGASTIEMKEVIVQELADRATDLQNNFHGKFVYRNCKVESYRQKRQEWRDKEESAQRKREMFQEITEQADKERAELDELLDTIEHQHDPGMAALGFGGKKKKSAATRKSQGAEQEKPATLQEEENAGEQDQEEEDEELKDEKGVARQIELESQRKRRRDDEIDQLFSARKKKGGAAADTAPATAKGGKERPTAHAAQSVKPVPLDAGEEEDDASEEAGEDDNEDERPRGRTAQASKDLAQILGAIEGTKRRKKAKGMSEDQRSDAAASTSAAPASAGPKPAKRKETLEEKMTRIKEEQRRLAGVAKGGASSLKIAQQKKRNFSMI